MSHVTEISSAARAISNEKMAVNATEVQVAMLKKNLDMEAQLQMQMISMLRQVSPHLAENINITA